MLIPTPPLRKSRRVKPKAPPTPLVLVSGVYHSAASIVLTFDRPINIASLAASAFVVNDNDDVGDRFEGSTATLGKTAGKDAARNKPTYVSLLGAPRARELAQSLRSEAHEALAGLGPRATRLADLADFIVARQF